MKEITNDDVDAAGPDKLDDLAKVLSRFEARPEIADRSQEEEEAMKREGCQEWPNSTVTLQSFFVHTLHTSLHKQMNLANPLDP